MNTITEQTRWRVSKALDMRYGERYIPCKYGVIRQYDDGDLDVWVTSTRIAKKLELRWKAKNTYEDGAFFIRPFADIDTVCKILKAKKRRVVTEAMRKRGRELASRFARSKKEPLLNDSSQA